MHTFLLIGLDPYAIDYSAPHMPPGATPERLIAMLDTVRQQFSDRGDCCDLCSVRPGASGEAPVTEQLSQSRYDGVLIGGGLRRPESLILLERVINSIHRHAPDSAIGFVDLPTEGLEVAARIMSQDFKLSGLLSQTARLDDD